MFKSKSAFKVLWIITLVILFFVCSELVAVETKVSKAKQDHEITRNAKEIKNLQWKTTEEPAEEIKENNEFNEPQINQLHVGLIRIPEESENKDKLETKASNFIIGEESYLLPYVQVNGARYFNEEVNVTLGGDVFVPLWQTYNKLLFTDARFYRGSSGIYEGNIHLGYRHLLEEKQQLYGIYAAFDRRRTDLGNYFNQITIGGECWIKHLFIGANFYQPIGDTSKLLYEGERAELRREGDRRHIYIVTDRYYEKAIGGADVRLGYEPIKGLVVYAGGYYFGAKEVSTIAGPMMEITYDFSLNKGRRVLGVFDKIGIEAGARRDKVRGTVWNLGVNLRIGLLPQKGRELDGVSRHMVDLVRRDRDVVSNESAQINVQEERIPGEIVDDDIFEKAVTISPGSGDKRLDTDNVEVQSGFSKALDVTSEYSISHESYHYHKEYDNISYGENACCPGGVLDIPEYIDVLNTHPANLPNYAIVYMAQEDYNALHAGFGAGENFSSNKLYPYPDKNKQVIRWFRVLPINTHAEQVASVISVRSGTGRIHTVDLGTPPQRRSVAPVPLPLPVSVPVPAPHLAPHSAPVTISPMPSIAIPPDSVPTSVVVVVSTTNTHVGETIDLTAFPPPDEGSERARDEEFRKHGFEKVSTGLFSSELRAVNFNQFAHNLMVSYVGDEGAILGPVVKKLTGQWGSNFAHVTRETMRVHSPQVDPRKFLRELNVVMLKEIKERGVVVSSNGDLTKRVHYLAYRMKQDGINFNWGKRLVPAIPIVSVDNIYKYYRY